ncbi:MAG: Rpn family recombination-promoting nuclease/putative transposase, partial [Muribaculaceae bacterium]|nr:Rpn family recombination-promoting nuclease/putative transposase [Muribaculaceae bacterium]
MRDSSHRVIDPILDVGFKLIFGRENVSEVLLMNLLNNIFKGDPLLGNITSLTFTNTERPNEYVEGKGIRYDIRCVTASGHRYLVEMQKGEQRHFLERSQYYVSRGVAEQGYRGKGEVGKDWDFSLVPVVGVFFCNFHVRGLEWKPVTKLRLCDEDSGKRVESYQRYAFIQLPCFEKTEGECGTLLE